ncbi:putative patched 1 [Fasciolopsis buskii]|uniref:Putative patched 1 n=1 Tax=Fasciolopsis buskii TaxID=27845 RepID=A0A8E0VLP3_9TREM|nr:putative patched 1 [Fasciolopsis buski]
MFATSLCCTTMRLWWRSKFARFEEFLHMHQWKVLSTVLLLVLFCLGLKMVAVDTDFDKLWVEESDRLISEWSYLAQALKRVSSQNAYTDQHYFGPDARRSRMLLRMNNPRSPLSPVIDSADPLPSGYGTGSSIPGPHATSSSGPFVNSLPGREFMGTMETVLQSAIEPLNAGGQPANDGESATLNSIQADASSSSSPSSTTESQILTPQALLDHMEFLIKVRRLQITVGSAKWSFKDLCHRATLPFGSEVHPIQAYLDMIIPCLIITPLDCFWEGAKVLGPEEATWVPW